MMADRHEVRHTPHAQHASHNLCRFIISFFRKKKNVQKTTAVINLNYD